MGPIQLMLSLFIAGFVKSSSGHLRSFNSSYTTLESTEAVNYCTNRSMSLVTLYDEDDETFMQSLVQKMPTLWVGLRKIANNTSDVPMCPSTSEERNCSDKLLFWCTRASNISNVKLNWCAAKQHCQYHSLGDLGNFTKDELNFTQFNETLWIGGNISDNFAWEDHGCSTYRKWKDGLHILQIGELAALEKEGLKVGSGAEWSVACSKGDVRIVVVNDTHLTWEQALDYCEINHSGLLQIVTPEDQTVVEKWLNSTLYEGTFWVGLRQSRVFGFWIWKDQMVNSSYWENGTFPAMPLSHQCGVIRAPGYGWRDYNCLYPLPFICEERIVRLN